MLKPFIPLLEKVSPARFHAHAAHETNLTAVETDDPALLFRYFDGLFLYGFFLAWAQKGSETHVRSGCARHLLPRF